MRLDSLGVRRIREPGSPGRGGRASVHDRFGFGLQPPTKGWVSNSMAARLGQDLPHLTVLGAGLTRRHEKEREAAG
jgi:hypothetical protein